MKEREAPRSVKVSPLSRRVQTVGERILAHQSVVEVAPGGFSNFTAKGSLGDRLVAAAQQGVRFTDVTLFADQGGPFEDALRHALKVPVGRPLVAAIGHSVLPEEWESVYYYKEVGISLPGEHLIVPEGTGTQHPVSTYLGSTHYQPPQPGPKYTWTGAPSANRGGYGESYSYEGRYSFLRADEAIKAQLYELQNEFTPERTGIAALLNIRRRSRA